ncbi:purine-binding chemotaxis protein CheW [Ectothiorhodospira magna]|uniref:Chemotaxis protein CheW n=1 Tax=Ectothiorhodospira magna TaxID=867345 RepID=A0A1H9ASI8_9GAMM|nr:chemotaxis protein CheW [Ectothiorhodospira magna]SEP79495.1 purine-binding chemotaxis protein CheW [Ectothiorhodospira magna]
MTQETVVSSPPEAGDIQSANPEQEADVRQFVIFICGSEVFGVDMAPVQEIIRVPEVVRVPMGPPALVGLSNLRGKVLPIISLRRLFDFDSRDNDDASRALVIDLGQPLGFVVDRVCSVVAVEPEKIEDVSGLSTTVNTEMLSGLLKDVGGFPMVMVMDFEHLISQEFADIARMARGHSAGALAQEQYGDEAEDDSEALQDELQLVSFEVAEQEYAIPIEHTQEIVQFPEQIVKVPRAEVHVLGVMSLRNRLLPLVSLRCLFELPDRTPDEHSRIVVVRLGTITVGLVMDSVNEVLRVPLTVVEAMPAMLSTSGNLGEISRICRLGQDGRRLVSIISIEHLFRHSSIQEAISTVKDMQEDDPAALDGQLEEQEDDEEQVVVFRLDREEFGVPIDSIQEIVRVPDVLTRVPKAPDFVEGVINLRGSVLPVIDQRRRLGLPATERNDRQRIMVFLLDGMRTGFIVDSVAEVLKIPRSAIEPSPQLSEEQARLIARVANMERQKRLIQLIDPSRLIAREQREALVSLTERQTGLRPGSDADRDD